MKLFFTFLLFFTVNANAVTTYKCNAFCYTEYIFSNDPAGTAQLIPVTSTDPDKKVALNNLDIECIEDYFDYDHKFLKVKINELPKEAKYNPSNHMLHKLSKEYLVTSSKKLDSSICSIINID